MSSNDTTAKPAPISDKERLRRRALRKAYREHGLLFRKIVQRDSEDFGKYAILSAKNEKPFPGSGAVTLAQGEVWIKKFAAGQAKADPTAAPAEDGDDA